MDKLEVNALLTKHSDEISELKIVSAQMMMIWKAVGTVALIALGVYLTGVL